MPNSDLLSFQFFCYVVLMSSVRNKVGLTVKRLMMKYAEKDRGLADVLTRILFLSGFHLSEASSGNEYKVKLVAISTIKEFQASEN